jgi:uncharacterized membrane protein YqjE
METRAPGSSGLLGSLRSFADGLLGSVHDRVELLSLELIQTCLWITAIVLLSLLTIVFGSFALVVWLWETSRLTAIVGLAGVYLVGTIAAVVLFKRFLARQPPPFAATLNELKHDRACIRPEN